MTRTLIVWGAGRIGRGFVADLFDAPAFHTVFVDIDRALVEELNARQVHHRSRDARRAFAARRSERFPRRAYG